MVSRFVRIHWSKQNILLGVFPRWLFRPAIEAHDILVLFVGDVNDVNLAARGHGLLDFLGVGLCLFLAGAEAQIDRELRHLEALVEQELPKLGREPALLLGADRQIEENEHPHQAISAKHPPLTPPARAARAIPAAGAPAESRERVCRWRRIAQAIA